MAAPRPTNVSRRAPLGAVELVDDVGQHEGQRERDDPGREGRGRTSTKNLPPMKSPVTSAATKMAVSQTKNCCFGPRPVELPRRASGCQMPSWPASVRAPCLAPSASRSPSPTPMTWAAAWIRCWRRAWRGCRGGRRGCCSTSAGVFVDGRRIKMAGRPMRKGEEVVAVMGGALARATQKTGRAARAARRAHAAGVHASCSRTTTSWSSTSRRAC